MIFNRKARIFQLQLNVCAKFRLALTEALASDRESGFVASRFVLGGFVVPKRANHLIHRSLAIDEGQTDQIARFHREPRVDSLLENDEVRGKAENQKIHQARQLQQLNKQ